MKYEIVEHTADLALRITGRTLEEIFENGADGLYSVLAVTGRPATGQVDFHLEEATPEDLLTAFLNELVYRAEVKKQRVRGIGVYIERTEAGYAVAVVGEAESILTRQREVKAATHHGLRIERAGERYVCTVILDL